jgi:hypothetical protein
MEDMFSYCALLSDHFVSHIFTEFKHILNDNFPHFDLLSYMQQ